MLPSLNTDRIKRPRTLYHHKLFINKGFVYLFLVYIGNPIKDDVHLRNWSLTELVIPINSKVYGLSSLHLI